MTKCDKIFNLLVSYDQIVILKGLKVSPLDQRTKKGFSKFYNFLGHKTSQCVLFRDLVQNIVKEGRLKFAEKQKYQPKGESDPKADEALFVEPLDLFMVDITKNTKGVEPNYEEQLKVVFPKADEELIHFLNRYKLKDSRFFYVCTAVPSSIKK